MNTGDLRSNSHEDVNPESRNPPILTEQFSATDDRLNFSRIYSLNLLDRGDGSCITCARYKNGFAYFLRNQDSLEHSTRYFRKKTIEPFITSVKIKKSIICFKCSVWCGWDWSVLPWHYSVLYARYQFNPFNSRFRIEQNKPKVLLSNHLYTLLNPVSRLYYDQSSILELNLLFKFCCNSFFKLLELILNLKTRLKHGWFS